MAIIVMLNDEPFDYDIAQMLKYGQIVVVVVSPYSYRQRYTDLYIRSILFRAPLSRSDLERKVERDLLK